MADATIGLPPRSIGVSLGRAKVSYLTGAMVVSFSSSWYLSAAALPIAPAWDV